MGRCQLLQQSRQVGGFLSYQGVPEASRIKFTFSELGDWPSFPARSAAIAVCTPRAADTQRGVWCGPWTEVLDFDVTKSILSCIVLLSKFFPLCQNPRNIGVFHIYLCISSLM